MTQKSSDKESPAATRKKIRYFKDKIVTEVFPTIFLINFTEHPKGTFGYDVGARAYIWDFQRLTRPGKIDLISVSLAASEYNVVCNIVYYCAAENEPRPKGWEAYHITKLRAITFLQKNKYLHRGLPYLRNFTGRNFSVDLCHEMPAFQKKCDAMMIELKAKLPQVVKYFSD